MLYIREWGTGGETMQLVGDTPTQSAGQILSRFAKPTNQAPGASCEHRCVARETHVQIDQRIVRDTRWGDTHVRG